MKDWAAGIESRNYGINRTFDAGMLSDLMRMIAPLVLIAASLLVYSWMQSRIINIGYESQSLFAVEESLRRVEERLTLEQATLMNPGRIDIIARNDLDMAPLHPRQLLLPPATAVGFGEPGVMAMAGSEAAAQRSGSTVVP
ncbi:MAG TPA: cell division protein FtsL [Acidobacteriota bacterium]|nr:cell division protein FtsL [Acidobacteriota bacterium]